MPYLKDEDKQRLELGEEPETPGELNFVVTRAALEFLEGSSLSYERLNAALGAIECAKLELYRRIVGPYEDGKIAENGDVFPASAPRVSARRRLTERFLADSWEVCIQYRGSVTGGLRTEARNAAVGGVWNSRHLVEHGWGLAVDAVFETGEGRTAAQAEMERRGWFSYIGPKYGTTQIHFQAFRARDPLPKET